MTNRYAFSIEWSEEDQEYMATCPAFPTLSAFGATEEEALAEGKAALSGFIATCKSNDIPLPEPLVRGTFSGKFQLRLPKSLHRLAVQMAQSEDVSLNAYIADAVRARVSGEQVAKPLIAEVRQHFANTQAQVASALTIKEPAVRYIEQTNTKELAIGQTAFTSDGVDRQRNH